MVKRNIGLKTGNTILGLFFVVTMGLTVWGVKIYDLTIIESKYLFIAFVIGAAIGAAIIPLLFKSSYSKFWLLFIGIIIGGGTFYFGLLYLNQAYCGKETTRDNFQILKTGSFGRSGKNGCRQLYAIIDFHGTKKKITFYCDFEKTIKMYSNIGLEYASGLFGFEVIKTKILLK